MSNKNNYISGRSIELFSINLIHKDCTAWKYPNIVYSLNSNELILHIVELLFVTFYNFQYSFVIHYILRRLQFLFWVSEIFFHIFAFALQFFVPYGL